MAPTGIVLHDPREQLRTAAERILARDGAGALTSRRVAAEAGVAKGVLHRCYRDYDDFLVDLVEHRATRIGRAIAQWGETWPGTEGDVGAGHSRRGSVAERVAGAVRQALDPVVLELVALVLVREEVSDRLRRPAQVRTPLLHEATQGLTTLLEAEQRRGRLSASADARALAVVVVAAVYVVLAGAPPDARSTEAVEAVVRSALGAAGEDVD